MAALLVAGLVVGGQALGAGGALTPLGCVGDNDPGADTCSQQTDGLGHVIGTVVSPNGKSLYAASLFDSAVATFKRNRTTGALKPRGCIEDPTSPDTCAKKSKGLKGVEGIAISPDSRSVYAAADSGQDVAIFKRNRKTGALKAKGCVADNDNGTAACAKKTDGLWGAHDVVVTPDGKFVYVASDNDYAVVILKRNTKTGALSPRGCVDDNDDGPDHCATSTNGLSGSYSLAVSRDGRFLYDGSEEGDNAIVTFKRNLRTGALKPKGCLDDHNDGPDNCAKSASGMRGLQQIVLSPNGKSLYSVAGTDNAVASFSVNRKTGALKPKGCLEDDTNAPDNCASNTPALNAAVGIGASPDGRSIYVASDDPDNSVLHLHRNRKTGKLTPGDCVNDNDTSSIICAANTDGLGQAVRATVSPDNRSVYISGESDSSIVIFSR
jgi:6-phosphogluconolactonase (cycloisomerase 2 family)